MTTKISNHNLANIYFPESKLEGKDGLLVGFNFEGFLFVITTVIPRDEIKSLDQLHSMLSEEKFQTFKWYCAGDPLILGVIESVDPTPSRTHLQLSKQPEILEFKQNKNIWITIEKRQGKLSLRDLIICEYKYKVMPHFILYPSLKPGEFLSLSGISFDDVLNNSKHWDKEKPLIETNELSRLYDLTDNDIIIRQINCSSILGRLLHDRVKSPDTAP